MGIRTTAGDPAVALYDSVTGLAFGEVFNSADDADSFLDYMRDVDGRDLRKLGQDTFAEARREWRAWRESQTSLQRKCIHSGCNNWFDLLTIMDTRIYCGKRDCGSYTVTSVGSMCTCGHNFASHDDDDQVAACGYLGRCAECAHERALESGSAGYIPRLNAAGVDEEYEAMMADRP